MDHLRLLEHWDRELEPQSRHGCLSVFILFVLVAVLRRADPPSKKMVTFLDFMTPVVHGQRQADGLYFDPSYTFDLVHHNLLLRKLSYLGFSDGYVSWFRSYLTNRQFRVRLFGTTFLSSEVSSGVPQGYVMGPFLFRLFINYLCKYIDNCTLFISADDLKISATLTHHMIASYSKLTLIPQVTGD
jgi:hypothetical protein